MALADMKGKYNAIFSLGDLCLASIQLRKFKLRPFAGPLDWMSSPSLSSVNRLLQNRFHGFMDLANLLPTGYSTGIDTPETFLVVHDQSYGIVSSHDFKADRNTLTNLATYPEVREKLDRRIQRMLTMMEKGKRILFVRTEATFSETLQLEGVLSKLVKKDFHILIINHTKGNTMTEKHWPLNRVTVVELPEYEKWTNNDHYWKEILDNVTIR
ncbi:DUF1796 family putative cysteine peptidase [Niallia sp. 01092]|uniref:DUF1796 family putative cysteine peptidase n=1 Tax=unclassified Niallia TaxID=2837522 RepID=UPI003FD6980C